MILDEFVKIKINKQNIKKINNSLNSEYVMGNVVDYPVFLLTKCSHVKIKVKCDICGNEKTISYQRYNDNIEKYNIYTCNNKCAYIKNTYTNMEKFGVKHYSETEEFKSKVRKDKPIKDKIIKDENYYRKFTEKVKNTKFVRYGDENYNNKDKNIITNQQKYGVNNVFELDIVKEKIKSTNRQKYGVDYPSQSIEIREKMINSYMINYGVIHPSQSIEIRNKIKNTCIERYGVEHTSQNKEIMDKILNSKKCNRFYNLTEYEKYRRIVDNLTLKNKKILFDNWNGFDYYDNNYIKNNLIKNYRCGEYPSIDHKYSVFYCFINNISEQECSDIKNLCITTRTNNSKKNRKTEKEYFEMIFNNS